MKKLETSLTVCQKNGLNALNEWYENKEEIMATLYGAAGTGKSFLIGEFLKNKKYRVAVSAPTHTAKNNVSKFSGLPGLTIQKLLGLAPNYDLEKFSPTNLLFDIQRKALIDKYKLIVIDEASMLNRELFNYIKNEAEFWNTKILFVGDDCQLPPIGENESPIFAEVKTQIELQTLVRQKADNPLVLYLLALRCDIKHQMNKDYSIHLETLIKFLNELEIEIADEIKKNTKNLFNFLLKLNLSWKRGITIIRNKEEFERMILRAFAKKESVTRVFAYTNTKVSYYNILIRNHIAEIKEEDVGKGDKLIGFSSVVSEENIPIIQNSVFYRVLKSTRVSTVFNGFPVPSYELYIKEEDNEDTFKINVVAPRYTENFKPLILDEYHYAVKVKGKAWPDYFNKKAQFLTMVDIVNKVNNNYEEKIPKEIDFGYAMTIHKGQGATTDFVFVDQTDIQKALHVGDYTTRQKMYLCLMYVALSRARDTAFLFLN